MALAYEIVPFLMTLSNLQCHLPIETLLKCNFSYSRAATYKTSTELSVMWSVCYSWASYVMCPYINYGLVQLKPKNIMGNRMAVKLIFLIKSLTCAIKIQVKINSNKTSAMKRLWQKSPIRHSSADWSSSFILTQNVFADTLNFITKYIQYGSKMYHIISWINQSKMNWF